MTNIERVVEINNILRTNAANARNEKRDFTEAEKMQNEELIREKSWLVLEINAVEMSRDKQEVKPEENSLVKFVREASNGNSAVTQVIRAAGDSMMTDDLGNTQPITVGEIVKAVEEKLIWKHLGIKMPTGLSGQYEWPVVGDVEATFAGEGVEVSPVKVQIDKVAVVQQRVAVSMALTRESVFNSKGKIEQIVREAEPAAIARAINKVVLSPVKIAGQSLEGPFVGATKKTVTFDFAGLMQAKAELLAKGYENDSLVWVMDEATKAQLECTPKDAGSGIMVIENDKLCGRPVFVASVMAGKIGLGDFRYQVVGQFGNAELIVDPFSKAKAGKIEFTTNANFGTATLVKDAFMLLTQKTTA